MEDVEEEEVEVVEEEEVVAAFVEEVHLGVEEEDQGVVAVGVVLGVEEDHRKESCTSMCAFIVLVVNPGFDFQIIERKLWFTTLDC